MIRGICKSCDADRELSAQGYCADCAGIVSLFDAALETARAHPTGARVVEVLEDWNVGRKARKARQGTT